MSNDEILKLHDFYELERNKQDKLTVRLDKLKIMRKIKSMGYYRYDTPDGGSQFVKIEDGRISLSNAIWIKDAFEDYVKGLPTREDKIVTDDTERETKITAEFLLSKLYQNIQNYLSDEMFNRLRPDQPIELLKDDRAKKYLFFKNTAVVVSADGVQNIPYSAMQDFNGYVWDNGILEHDFVYTPVEGDFEHFVNDICANDPQRKLSLMSMLGYLMHDNHECTNKAVLLTDASNDEIGVSAGGTGKGLLGKALSCMLNKANTDNRYCAINGKDIDLKSNTRYALADLSTQLIHIEDLYKGADFEQLFCDITDGATIRKPYQVKPIKKMIKMMISVNHTLNITSESSKMRRVYIFELANYYGANYTPEDKYGRRFFESDWTSQDWICFYSFMCRCIQVYLTNGVQIVNNSEYRIRELLESTNQDFIYWLNEVIDYKHKTEQKYIKKTLWDSFFEKYPSFSTMRPATLTAWTKKYFNYKNIDFVEMRSTDDIFVIYPTAATRATATAKKNSLRNIC